jgi:chemotaxis protein CheX
VSPRPVETEDGMTTATNGTTSPCVDLIRESTMATFRTICGGEAEFIGLRDMKQDPIGVQGIIAVVGDLSWSVSLAFPQKTAEALAPQFAGFEIAYDTPDMNDMIGEIANVLAGDVVARLDAQGHDVRMSLPTVARGQNLHVHQPGAVLNVCLFFHIPQGSMSVGLSIGKGARC